MKDYTVEFLRAISNRLSSRQSCRQVEYTVVISIEPCNIVVFEPNVEVFPDTHHRQHTDLRSVVSHIMRTQFGSTVYDQDDEYGQPRYKSGSLTPGTYKYVLSFDRKRRQWTRIR